MKKYGLIGFPLGHSFSGKYFKEKFHPGIHTGLPYIPFLKFNPFRLCRRS